MAKFRQIHGFIVVSHRDHIVAGGRLEVEEYWQSKQTPQVSSSPMNVVDFAPTQILDVSFEECKLLCRLAAQGAFARPIAVGSIDDKDVECLEENFDVRIDKQPNGVYLIS
jgi:hypothetical protein